MDGLTSQNVMPVDGEGLENGNLQYQTVPLILISFNIYTTC